MTTPNRVDIPLVPYLTPIEIAAILRVERKTVLRWLRVGRMKGIKVGNMWRIDPKDFADFIADGGHMKKEADE